MGAVYGIPQRIRSTANAESFQAGVVVERKSWTAATNKTATSMLAIQSGQLDVSGPPPRQQPGEPQPIQRGGKHRSPAHFVRTGHFRPAE